MWKNQRLQEIIHATATKYSPCYVFRRDMIGRHQLQRGIFSLPRDHQRAIILWVLGRNVQPWEPFRYCGLASDIKKHLEQCRLPENPPSPLMAPSHIKHELSLTGCPRLIRALAGQILGLVGRGPQRRPAAAAGTEVAHQEPNATDPHFGPRGCRLVRFIFCSWFRFLLSFSFPLLVPGSVSSFHFRFFSTSPPPKVISHGVPVPTSSWMLWRQSSLIH